MWDISKQGLTVGAAGDGTLTIEGGGKVSNGFGTIGNDAGTNGTVTVSGTDTDGNASTWVNSANLLVGGQGNGKLIIQDGGTVTDWYAYVGYGDGSTGTATVTGAGSTWTNSTGLIVGYHGTGELTVEDGGTVSSGGSLLIGSGDITGWGNGNLTISSGGTVNTQYFAAIANEIGTSTALITGTDSTWAVTGELLVGRGARGTADGSLAIENGGKVSAVDVQLGVETDASGTVVLNGTDGARGVLETGYVEKGAGSASVSFYGGILRATGDEADFLRGFDDGDLTIDAGGAFFDTNGFDVAASAPLSGTGNLEKIGTGTLSLSGGIDVGNLGVEEGELRIAGGANHLGGNAQVDAAGDPSKLTVDGSDTSLEASALTVGRDNAGAFELTGGAQVTMPGATSANAFVLGYTAGSDGQALIAGEDSVLSVAGGTTRIGRAGFGSLAIENGGRFESGYLVTIGNYEGGEGHVSVSGEGSSLVTSGNAPTYVGDSGTGTIEILEGGHVTTSYLASVGHNIGSEGSALVSGADSSWVIDGNLNIGDYGKGTVVLAEGGHADLGNDSYSNVTLGAGEGASGTLVIGSKEGVAATGAGTINARSIFFSAGTGKLVFNHTDDDYVFGLGIRMDPFTLEPNGDHSIEHRAGNTTYTGNGSAFDGVTTVSGGAFIVDGSLGGTVNVGTGATLGGTGTVGSTTVEDGGILAPGNSIGTLTVNGDLNLSSGSILDYQLGDPGVSSDSPGASDTIDVTGDLALNGTLNLAQSGDTADGAAGFGYYRLMTYGGGLTGNGLTIGSTPTLSDRADYEVQTGGGNVDLFVSVFHDPGDDSLQHWQGGGGTWNATNTQWLNIGSGATTGEVPVAWAGNTAVFKNDPGGFDGGTIDVHGSQSFKGLQFVDNGYVLRGDGELQTDDAGSEIRVLAGTTAAIATAIGGTGGISKTQGGTLVLSGTNTYQGGTSLLGGVLSVSSDANLGAASGELTFDGGTLASTADMGSARAITLTGDGGFDVAPDTTLALSGDIDGTGDLVKTGAGTLHLAGHNVYGNTIVRDGGLIGNTASISGNIVNDGEVAFYQEEDRSFAGNIGGSGTMRKFGFGTLTLDGQSTLDWTVDVGGLVSSASRFTGDVDIGTAGSFTLKDDQNVTYAGALVGGGTFTKAGSGGLLYTGNGSAFTGTTTVGSGLFSVGDDNGNGSLGGTIDVLSGATLGGSGTVGAVSLGVGSAIAPGNSIGTLTVAGDITFDPDSTYDVEVDPEGADSDLIHATGQAHLNGASVAHIGTDGNYKPSSTYTILTADGGIDGTFGSVTSNYAFLTPDLSYDTDSVNLQLDRNQTDFADMAQTRNQKATAGGLDSLDTGSDLYNAVVTLPDDGSVIRGAFDVLSGEIHASVKGALIDDSHFARDAIDSRIRSAFGDVASSALPVMAYGPDGVRAAPADVDDLAVWTQGYGSWGSFDSDGNAGRLDTSTGGLFIGADAPVGNWRIGLMGGYGHSSFDDDARASSADVDNYTIGVYAGASFDHVGPGDIGLRFGALHTWYDIDTDRGIVFPGFAGLAETSYDARAMQVFGEAGYTIRAGQASFEPFANLAYVSLHTDGYDEDGIAGLHSGSDTTDVTYTTLGLRAATAIDLGTMTGRLHGMLGWRHAFGDTTPLATHAFTGSSPFTVAGVPIARDAALIEGGFDVNLTKDASLGLSYQGQFGGGITQNGFKARLQVKF